MQKFSALSIVSPGGKKILEGKKTLEIRQWQPDVLPLKNLVIVQNEKRLSSSGISEDPDGMAIAMVDIIEVRPWKENDLEASCGSYWEDGWLAWEIVNVRPINYSQPVPAKLRIYDIELPQQNREG